MIKCNVSYRELWEHPFTVYHMTHLLLAFINILGIALTKNIAYCNHRL